MDPAMSKNTAAPLRTVGDGEAVDTRRVAQEIAGEVIAILGAVG